MKRQLRFQAFPLVELHKSSFPVSPDLCVNVILIAF